MSIQLQLYEDNFKIVDIDAGLHFNLAFTVNTILEILASFCYS